jgi:hypothetical protein
LLDDHAAVYLVLPIVNVSWIFFICTPSQSFSRAIFPSLVAVGVSDIFAARRFRARARHQVENPVATLTRYDLSAAAQCCGVCLLLAGAKPNGFFIAGDDSPATATVDARAKEFLRGDESKIVVHNLPSSRAAISF